VRTVSDDVSLQSSATVHENVLILVGVSLLSIGLVFAWVQVSPFAVVMFIYMVQKVLLKPCLEKRRKSCTCSSGFRVLERLTLEPCIHMSSGS